MILWGLISEFPLFAVLQFLAGQRRTGVLEIEDFEELGTVYLETGRITGVSTASWDEILGARLVAAGLLTEKEVKECWLRAGRSDEEQRPVLAYLLEAAKATEGHRHELQGIVDRYTVDAVMQLIYWNSGTFRFQVPARQLAFAVIPSLGVDELLLEAYRRADEGERPWRERILPESELCATCTIECSEDIRKRFLRSDVCLWRSMPSLLKESIYRDVDRGAVLPGEDTGDDLPFL